MKKDGSRVVSVMKEYVVEVEEVEMPLPRFSCLVRNLVRRALPAMYSSLSLPCLNRHVEHHLRCAFVVFMHVNPFFASTAGS